MIRFLHRWWGSSPHGLQTEHEYFLNLTLAYACPVCKSIQERAEQGKCKRCGNTNIVSVENLLNWSTSEFHRRLMAARERKHQPRAPKNPTQEPQCLTEFRVKNA